MRYDVSPLITLSVMAALSLVISVDPFTFAFAAIAGVLWAYFIVSLRIVKRIEATFDLFPSRAFVDEDVAVRTVFENPSDTSLSNVEVYDGASNGYLSDGKKENSGVLERKGSVAISYSIRFKSRGEHTFKDVKLVSESFLKLFYIERVFESERKVLIFPKILEIDRLKTSLIEPISGVKTDFRILEDSSHITGVHEYAGEPAQRIHWNASAHLGDLMVKEYEYTGSSVARMYVDYNLPKEVFARKVWEQIRIQYEEYAAVAASGIVRYLVGAGSSLTLKVLARKVYKVAPRDSGKDYIPYLDVLARAEGTGDPEDGTLLLNQVEGDLHSMTRTTTVIILALYLTDDVVPKLLTIRSRVSRVVVFVMPYGFRMPFHKKYDTYSVFPREIERLREKSAILVENKVEVHVMKDNESLDEVMEHYRK